MRELVMANMLDMLGMLNSRGADRVADRSTSTDDTRGRESADEQDGDED